MAERLCLGCMEKINDKYIECPYCGYIDGIPAKEAYHMEPGSVLSGRYIVGRVVGYGGFGVTYIGYDGLLEKKIAIKEYLPSEFATRMPGQTEVTVYTGERQEQFYSGIDKFVEEAKRLAQFKEVPGIVRIYDSFTENKTAYIIMEYLEGETLKSRLKREGRLSVEESLRIIMPILTALKEVHKIGIIHRDIAPDNIFLTSKGEVKLLDFGAARYATTTHSKSLSVIIKQGYAPEEQYRSRGDQGPWTDVYACGATLYKMLTGVTPEDSMERAGKDTLQPPSKQGVKLSKNLDTAIMNAMNIRIEDRTQSAEEFEAELVSEAEIKRKKNHERKMDIGRWPIGVKIGAMAVACGLVTFGVLLATNVIHFDMKQSVDNGLLAANEVYVPNVVNYGVTEAEEMTLENSLVLQITDKQNSDMIPKDKILSQNLTDGIVVEAGTTLEVVVSAGGEVVYLQDLSGMELEEAKAILDSLGIYYEIQEEESEIAPGYIIAQDVDENTGIEKGTTVVLTVSTGISKYDETALTTVPELVDKDWNNARKSVKDAKLYIYKISTEFSDSIPKGQVISQDITAGTQVTQGTKVGVVVSLGIEMIRVPDVQYKDKNLAVELLSDNNLIYEIQYEDNNTVAKDHVIRQSIAAGSEVAPQTKIILYVSNGKLDANSSTEIAANEIEENNSNVKQNNTEGSVTVSKIKMPNVTTNFMESDAKQKLQNLGLQVQVEYVYCYWVGYYPPDGSVLGQSVQPGSLVDKNTLVTIVVLNTEEGEVPVVNSYQHYNVVDRYTTEHYGPICPHHVVGSEYASDYDYREKTGNEETYYLCEAMYWSDWSDWIDGESNLQELAAEKGMNAEYEYFVSLESQYVYDYTDEYGVDIVKRQYRIRYKMFTYTVIKIKYGDEYTSDSETDYVTSSYEIAKYGKNEGLICTGYISGGESKYPTWIEHDGWYYDEYNTGS